MKTILPIFFLIAAGSAVADGMPIPDGPMPAKKPIKGVDVRAATHPSKVSGSSGDILKNAVKDTPPKENDFPGVLKIDGEALDALDPSRVRIISMGIGAQTVFVSKNEPNRIQLPFKNPKIVTLSDVAEVSKVGTSNNVYVNMAKEVEYATIFLENPLNDNSVVTLQLVPRDIPAQTIIVRDDSLSTPKRKGSNEYVSNIQNVFEVIAKDGIPDGFSRTPLDMASVSFNGFMLTGKDRLSNGDGDVYIYLLKNVTDSSIRISEKEFDGPKVLAVSIFPSPLIDASGTAKVIVYTKKGEQ